MRELDLFRQYLVRLRQQKLEAAHLRALQSDAELLELRLLAREAEFCSAMSAALGELEKDPGRFIAQRLQWRES